MNALHPAPRPAPLVGQNDSTSHHPRPLLLATTIAGTVARAYESAAGPLGRDEPILAGRFAYTALVVFPNGTPRWSDKAERDLLIVRAMQAEDADANVMAMREWMRLCGFKPAHRIAQIP